MSSAVWINLIEIQAVTLDIQTFGVSVAGHPVSGVRQSIKKFSK